MVKKNDSETANDLENGQYTGREAIQQVILKITRNTVRECLIMGPVLESQFFNHSDFIEALSAFATLHPRNLARILIENSEQVIRENGRLITLCRRLSENLRIRSTPKEYQGQSDLFFIADHQTMMLQSNVSNPDIIVSINDKTVAEPYVRRFEYAWQRSIPMPGLHILGL